MKITPRSFPHPVIGNRDDIPEINFEAELGFSSDKENYYVLVKTLIDSDEIKNLLKENKIEFVLHVECGNTMFRRAFKFSENEKTIKISANCLNDIVEVNLFMCASKNINSYALKGFNADYSGTSFDIQTGDVLGITDGYIFFADNIYDTTGQLDSIMQIEASGDDEDKLMAFDFDAEKIRIILSKNDYQNYLQLKIDPNFSMIISQIFVLPALCEALTLINEDGDSIENYRWAKSLKNKIETLGLDIAEEPILNVQKILDFPFRRVLTTAMQIVEGANS